MHTVGEPLVFKSCQEELSPSNIILNFFSSIKEGDISGKRGNRFDLYYLRYSFEDNIATEINVLSFFILFSLLNCELDMQYCKALISIQVRVFRIIVVRIKSGHQRSN